MRKKESHKKQAVMKRVVYSCFVIEAVMLITILTAVFNASRNSQMIEIQQDTSGWYYNTTDDRKNYDQVMASHQMLSKYFETFDMKRIL